MSFNFAYTNHSLMQTVSGAVSDIDIARAAVRGDDQAIAWIYQHSGALLYTVCRRYATSDEAAQDLFHDGFLHLLAQLSKYNGQAALQTWAYRVMVNYCINQLRKASNKINWTYLDEVAEIEDETEDDGEWSQMKLDDVLKCIQDMPPGFRLVLNMYIVDDKSHLEIAEALNISESTSKSQLFKARRWLRKKLNEMEARRG